MIPLQRSFGFIFSRLSVVELFPEAAIARGAATEPLLKRCLFRPIPFTITSSYLWMIYHLLFSPVCEIGFDSKFRLVRDPPPDWRDQVFPILELSVTHDFSSDVFFELLSALFFPLFLSSSASNDDITKLSSRIGEYFPDYLDTNFSAQHVSILFQSAFPQFHGTPSPLLANKNHCLSDGPFSPDCHEYGFYRLSLHNALCHNLFGSQPPLPCRM